MPWVATVRVMSGRQCLMAAVDGSEMDAAAEGKVVLEDESAADGGRVGIGDFAEEAFGRHECACGALQQGFHEGHRSGLGVGTGDARLHLVATPSRRR